ncbi:MAG: cytochrome-c peroxidase, partial [Bacteroidota bacterium]
LSSSDDDLGVTRSPTLRDVVKINGMTNGPLMHTGEMASLSEVLDHYNQITQNTDLDNRLRGGATGQNLNMTNDEKVALIAFLQTLSGTNVYQDSKWADPFLE